MNNRVLSLDRGDLLELADAAGTTLRMTRGRLWVTQEGDGNDVVLNPGDVWTVERSGLTIAEAQDDASLVLIGGTFAYARLESRRPRLSARISAWLERLAQSRPARRWVPHY